MVSQAFVTPTILPSSLTSVPLSSSSRLTSPISVTSNPRRRALVLRSPFEITCSSAPSSSSSSSSFSSSASNSNSSPTLTSTSPNRRSFLLSATSFLVLLASPLSARSEKSTLTGDYSADAATVLADMRAACDLARGTPGMADTVKRTRQEMNDFVALYRRNGKVAGSTSFSTLYTAINTLSGHYASYGNSYPVPEKRKKRLSQQFTDVDRALNRGR